MISSSLLRAPVPPMSLRRSIATSTRSSSRLFAGDGKLDQLETLDAYKAAVTAQDKLVMVEWSATWCGPCKAVEPKLVELEEEMSSELKVYKIIYDSNPGFKSLAKAFEIQALPSFQYYRNGELVGELVTGAKMEKIRAGVEVAMKAVVAN